MSYYNNKEGSILTPSANLGEYNQQHQNHGPSKEKPDFSPNNPENASNSPRISRAPQEIQQNETLQHKEANQSTTPRESRLSKMFNLKSILSFRFLNLLILSTSFLLIFCGYNTAQNFMTSIHSDVGAISLGIVYLCFSLSNIVAPTLVQISPKWSISISFVAYSIFVLSSAIPTPNPKEGIILHFFNGIYDIYTTIRTGSCGSSFSCYWENIFRDFAFSYFGVFAIFFASALVGSVAGVLWTAQGTYLTNLGIDKQRKIQENGFFSGVFFCIYELNLILGNILVLALLVVNINIYLIFICMALVAGAGNVLSLFLYPYECTEIEEGNEEKELQEENEENSKSNVRKESNSGTQEKMKGIESKDEEKLYYEGIPKAKGGKNFYSTFSAEKEGENAEKPKKRMNILAKLCCSCCNIRKLNTILKDAGNSVITTLLVMIDKRMLLLAPLFLYAGFTNEFFYGTLPLITRNEVWIAIAFILFGIAECVSSIVIGKGNDVFGRRAMIYVTLLIHALAIIASFEPIFLFSGRTRLEYDEATGKEAIVTEGYPITIFLTFILWGLGDAALCTTIFSIIPTPQMFGSKNTAGAFAAYNLYHALATSLMFAISIFLKELFFVYHLTLIVMLIISAVCVMFLDCCIARFDAKSGKRLRKKKQDVEESA